MYIYNTTLQALRDNNTHVPKSSAEQFLWHLEPRRPIFLGCLALLEN